MRALNLEAGLGGNRKNWPDYVQVTAVELDPRIAAVYRRLYPRDKVIVGDAGAYLLEHFEEFDFIWSSPPCQTRSKMNRATRHKSCRRYVDMSVYQRVIFLRTYFKGWWVVENVVPYFEELIAPSVRMGRHHFWTNFACTPVEVPTPPNFINRCDLAGKAALMDWLGIHYPENIYYGTNHCPAQILRNCVHPVTGLHVFNAATESMRLKSHGITMGSAGGGRGFVDEPNSLSRELAQACELFEQRGSRSWLEQNDPYALSLLDRWNKLLKRPRHERLKLSA